MEEQEYITKYFNCPYVEGNFQDTPGELAWVESVGVMVSRGFKKDNGDGTALVDMITTPVAMEIILKNPRYQFVEEL